MCKICITMPTIIRVEVFGKSCEDVCLKLKNIKQDMLFWFTEKLKVLWRQTHPSFKFMVLITVATCMMLTKVSV